MVKIMKNGEEISKNDEKMTTVMKADKHYKEF